MSDTLVFDEFIVFGENASMQTFTEAIDACGCVEEFERGFGIEVSCGDGVFLSDIDIFTNDELAEKYDGEVCIKGAPRYADTHKLLDVDRKYRFTIDNPDDSYRIRDCVFYINGNIVNN
jgi:hypothetical protein